MNAPNIFAQPVEELISRVDKYCHSLDERLPSDIEDEMSISPDWAIDLIKQLEYMNQSANDRRTEILFRLIDESLRQIRYRIDRKDEQGFVLLTNVQEALRNIMPTLSSSIRFAVNRIMFDSKLPFEIDEHYDLSSAEGDKRQIDIMPKVPELLDSLRREKVFKTCFELYELILPQIQLMPTMTQLSIIAEMAMSKKAIVHELAVLMLLHPKHEIRKRVPEILYKLSDDRVFTPVDLRRLITIRNWVPIDERKGIDEIISHLRRNKLSPAPYIDAKLSKLVGSSMDGAGVLFIMMESKTHNQRKIAGFLLKIGVGVREPWVRHKAPKGYFYQLIEEQDTSLQIKSVSKAYVNKIVQHFLSESIENNIVPEATFIEIAELFGANNWQPQPLSFTDEINRLQKIYKDDLTEASIKRALQRSGKWHLYEDVTHSWFESGDFAERSLIEATKKHEEDPSQSLETIVTECLMDHCLEKWKMIFLVTCLWMRSKEKEGLCYDLFAVLHCLANGTSPSNIPLICNVAAQSTASILKREMY